MGYEKLEQAGLKVTIQRMAILDYLETTLDHPTADMVFNEIKKKYPRVTLSTIYNTLETFVENNIIAKVYTLEGKARYDGHIEKHHHFYDKTTGKIFDIYDEELNSLINEYLKNKKNDNFQISDYQVDFIGEIVNQ